MTTIIQEQSDSTRADAEAEADAVEEAHAAALLGLLFHIEGKPPGDNVRVRAFRHAECVALRFTLRELFDIEAPPPKRAKARAPAPEITVIQRSPAMTGSQVST